MKPRLSLNPLLRSLSDRHSSVQREIDGEQARPRPDGFKLAALKKLKLRMRDRIEILQRAKPGAPPVVVVRRSSRKPYTMAEA